MEEKIKDSKQQKSSGASSKCIPRTGSTESLEFIPI